MSPVMTPPDKAMIEIVLPVHNEAESIGATLQEFYRVASDSGYPVRFYVCEDGSSDGTPDVLRSLSAILPLTVDSVAGRRGYSKAVIDGFKGCSAPIIGFVDSDGQCDPADLALLAGALEGADMVVGYRNPRVDPRVRRLMSSAFGMVYKAAFPVRRRDPSCPYLLIRREALQRVLQGRPGILPQGFWWEFAARAHAAGLSVIEVPVNHRPRAAGRTQVYRPTKMPRIVWDHLLGLIQLRRDLVATGN